MSKSKTKINQKYNKKKYERIELTVLRGRKELIQAAAEKENKSVNRYIKDLIDKEMGGVITEGQYEDE